MKPRILNVIHNSNNNVIFTYPLNTLLDKIVDQWSLIMDYHENYYPFAVGKPDKNYREVIPNELDSEMFMKLFIITYKKNKIKTNNFKFPNVDALFISIYGKRLCVTDDDSLYMEHIASSSLPEVMFDNISNKYIQNPIVPKQTFLQIEEGNSSAKDLRVNPTGGNTNIKYVDFEIEPNNIKKIFISRRNYIEFSIYHSNIPLLVLLHIDL